MRKILTVNLRNLVCDWPTPTPEHPIMQTHVKDDIYQQRLYLLTCCYLEN